MLTRLYLEAILVGPELADMVWEAWDSGVITNEQSKSAWIIIANEEDYFESLYPQVLQSLDSTKKDNKIEHDD